MKKTFCDECSDEGQPVRYPVTFVVGKFQFSVIVAKVNDREADLCRKCLKKMLRVAATGSR